MPINPQYVIYKPSMKNFELGTASSWEFSPTKKCMFLKTAKQSRDKNKEGRPTFDWKGGQQMKLGLSDLSEILLVLTRNKKFAGNRQENNNKGSGLFHKDTKGNTILKLYQDQKQDSGFIMEFSSKKKSLFRAAQRISIQESMILSVIITRVMWQIFAGTGEDLAKVD